MTTERFDLATAPLDAGTVLLEASAGTGKTYTLVGILLRLLLEKTIDRLDQALVVTFTIAATEELKTRLRGALAAVLRAVHAGSDDPFFAALARLPDAEPRLRQALDDFDQVAIATIHGFCKRLLDEAAFESREPFDVEFTADQAPLLLRAAADALRALYRAELTPVAAVLTTARLDPAALVNAYQLWQRHPDVGLQPAEPDLEPHLRELATALAVARDTFPPEMVEPLARLAWKKDSKVGKAGPETFVQKARDRACRDPLLAIAELLEFAPSSLAETLPARSRKPSADDHPLYAACERIATAYAEALAHLRASLLRDMHRRVEIEKRRTNVLSFQDLLLRTHQALRDPDRRGPLLGAVRERYRVALIDEFQDTDVLQYEIFATCFAQRPLFLIGDPKQSIYGFRGADLHTYFAARDDAAQQGTLDVNFRSSRELVAAVGSLFGLDHAFAVAAIGMPVVTARAAPGELQITGDGDGALRWRYTGASTKGAAEECIAADVAAEIARLLLGDARIDDRPLRPRDLAVLTRTNRQAVLVQQRLREAGVMAAIGKAGNIFETDELVELERFLLAVLRPNDVARVRAAMATRLWGHDAGSLQARDPTLDRELEDLDRWRRLWLRRGFVVMFEQALVDLQVLPRWLAWRDGERRLTNLRQLVELLHGAEHLDRLSPDGLVEWLQSETRRQQDIDYELRELRLESDENAVQILTIHGSKGLQYEVVFCPFLWDGRKPRGAQIVATKHGRAMEWDPNGAQKNQVEADRLAEDLRLAYVGFTRARRRLYVHWGPLGRDYKASALAWLLTPQRPATLPDDASWYPAWTKALKDESNLRARLLERIAASHGTMRVDDVPESPVAATLPPPPPMPLAPACVAERMLRPRSQHSFTSLVAGGPPGEVARDVADRPSQAVSGAVAASGIFAFARGAAAGQCLHTILERVDLRQLDDDRATRTVRTVLQQHGLDQPAAHAGPLDPVADVLAMLRDLADSRVGPDAVPLATLGGGARAVEWQFTLPVPHADLGALAGVFARHGGAIARAYADRLAALPPQRLRGFLTGFADLVTEHRDRIWLFDWKSNHLGNDRRDYVGAPLHAAMTEHDYVLQYHLYVLALHRQLRARRADYDYERHFGGVSYAFLRGVQAGTASGLFDDRPPRALVEALDHWAGGGA